jgi:P27 family predicted phage terminase small subunit
MKLTTQIVKFLKDKGIYEGIDTTLREELAFNKEICEAMREDIETRGYLINVAGEGKPEYMQHNPSIGVYSNALKNINTLSTKLGIAPTDRLKWGLKTQEGKDDLDSIL